MRFNTQLYDLFSTLHGYSIRNGVILLKIERLSENQIRCTLNKADLADKQLKISELAYGSPKAKEVDVNYEDIKKNKLKNESVSLDEELIDILIESVDSDVKYGNTEKINKTRGYLESMEDYLFGDHTAEIMLESIEEDLGIL